MIDLSSIDILRILDILRNAGHITNRFLNDAHLKLNIQKKLDQSPITDADKAANDYIVGELDKYFDFAIVSEENSEENNLKALESDIFFLVDPVDGTQSFIEGKTYAINIALIVQGVPILGFIAAPLEKIIYFTNYDVNSNQILTSRYLDKTPNIELKNIELLTSLGDAEPSKESKNREKDLVIATNYRSKKSELFQPFLDNLEKVKTINFISSAYKFCVFIEKKADIILFLCQAKEWDIAAGDALVRYAGGRILTYPENKHLVYGKKSLNSSCFVASWK